MAEQHQEQSIDKQSATTATVVVPAAAAAAAATPDTVPTIENLESLVPPTNVPSSHVSLFRGEWDEEGCYVYQAYNDEIADWALANQQFGGPAWKPTRMTWIKPSLGWMLYRSGYGYKPGQTRILKVKLSHADIAHILSTCKCTDTNRKTQMTQKMKKRSTYGNGRVQWDPERDLYQAEGRVPRRMLRTRAIQIGMAGCVSQYYANHTISIQEVTDLAHRVALAHRLKNETDTVAAMDELRPALPVERPYMPLLSESKLRDLALLPGDAATVVAKIGRGCVDADLYMNT